MSVQPNEKKTLASKVKAVQSANAFHKPNPTLTKTAEKSTTKTKTEDKDDQKLKELVREIKEPRENTRRNIKTANSHQSIPRNINEYRHLISGFDGGFNITENDIDWVLKLRSPDLDLSTKSKRVTEHLYSFYGKTLECSQGKKSTVDLGAQGNVNSIDHLLRGRLGPTPGLGVVAFETSLRNPGKVDPSLKEREKRWSAIPKKDKKGDYPCFLPKLKDEIKMKKTITDGDLTKLKLETAFDPDTAYPKYQEKFRYKNLNNLTHLLKPGNNLPMVQWQLSLR